MYNKNNVGGKSGGGAIHRTPMLYYTNSIV